MAKNDEITDELNQVMKNAVLSQAGLS